MAGKLVPLVMLPRYSSFVGLPSVNFTTIPVEVSSYQKATLTVWRGPMRSNWLFRVTCQESSDQQAWTTCSGTNANQFDPGANTEGVATPGFTKRWFRLSIELGSVADMQVTCWAVGHLETRER